MGWIAYVLIQAILVDEDRIRAVVDCARDKNIPIRIGVNAGSLEKDIAREIW